MVFSFSVALALREANLVSRNIGPSIASLHSVLF